MSVLVELFFIQNDGNSATRGYNRIDEEFERDVYKRLRTMYTNQKQNGQVTVSQHQFQQHKHHHDSKPVKTIYGFKVTELCTNT